MSYFSDLSKSMGWPVKEESEFKYDQDYQQEMVARFLANYDEKTWQKLKPDRKRTYIRAANLAINNPKSLIQFMKDLGNYFVKDIDVQ